MSASAAASVKDGRPREVARGSARRSIRGSRAFRARNEDRVRKRRHHRYGETGERREPRHALQRANPRRWRVMRRGSQHIPPPSSGRATPSATRYDSSSWSGEAGGRRHDQSPCACMPEERGQRSPAADGRQDAKANPDASCVCIGSQPSPEARANPDDAERDAAETGGCVLQGRQSGRRFRAHDEGGDVMADEQRTQRGEQEPFGKRRRRRYSCRALPECRLDPACRATGDEERPALDVRCADENADGPGQQDEPRGKRGLSARQAPRRRRVPRH